MSGWNRELRAEIIGPVAVAIERLEAARREVERAEAAEKGQIRIADCGWMLADAHPDSIIAAVLIDIRDRIIRIESDGKSA